MQGVATISAAAANDMITDLCFDLDLEVKVQEAPPHFRDRAHKLHWQCALTDELHRSGVNGCNAWLGAVF